MQVYHETEHQRVKHRDPSFELIGRDNEVWNAHPGGVNVVLLIVMIGFRNPEPKVRDRGSQVRGPGFLFAISKNAYASRVLSP